MALTPVHPHPDPKYAPALIPHQLRTLLAPHLVTCPVSQHPSAPWPRTLPRLPACGPEPENTLVLSMHLAPAPYPVSLASPPQNALGAHTLSPARGLNTSVHSWPPTLPWLSECDPEPENTLIPSTPLAPTHCPVSQHLSSPALSVINVCALLAPTPCPVPRASSPQRAAGAGTVPRVLSRRSM